jgi:hypothetical protein
MPKFKVSSGEFEVIVEEKTHRKAGDLAIQLHDESNHPSKLGEMTLIERLDHRSQPIGDHAFITTQHLIDDNTAGFGSELGQYRRLTEEDEK